MGQVKDLCLVLKDLIQIMIYTTSWQTPQNSV